MNYQELVCKIAASVECCLNDDDTMFPNADVSAWESPDSLWEVFELEITETLTQEKLAATSMAGFEVNSEGTQLIAGNSNWMNEAFKNNPHNLDYSFVCTLALHKDVMVELQKQKPKWNPDYDPFNY